MVSVPLAPMAIAYVRGQQANEATAPTPTAVHGAKR